MHFLLAVVMQAYGNMEGHLGVLSKALWICLNLAVIRRNEHWTDAQPPATTSRLSVFPFLSVSPLRPSIPKLSVWLLCLNSFLGLLISPDLCLVTEGIIPASSCDLWQVLLLQLPSLLAWDLQVVKRQKKSAGLLIWYSKGRDCEASLSRRLPFLVNRQQPCTPVQSLCKTDDKLPF